MVMVRIKDTSIIIILVMVRIKDTSIIIVVVKVMVMVIVRITYL